jgi:hypothetical protein
MSIMYVFVPHLAWGEPFPSKSIDSFSWPILRISFLAHLPEKTSEFKHGCDKLPHTVLVSRIKCLPPVTMTNQYPEKEPGLEEK